MKVEREDIVKITMTWDEVYTLHTLLNNLDDDGLYSAGLGSKDIVTINRILEAFNRDMGEV